MGVQTVSILWSGFGRSRMEGRDTGQERETDVSVKVLGEAYSRGGYRK